MENDEAIRAIGQISVNAEKIAAELRELTAEAADDRATVTVTCGVGGRLIDIAFDARARRLDTVELREAVLVASQRAAAAAEQRFNELLGQITGSAAGLGEVTDRATARVAQFQRLAAEQMQRLEEIRNSLNGDR